MRNTKRERNRWLTAVAMTCLSGFALCGCTRGTHGISSNLQENAGREALQAERDIAARKRPGSSSAKSKEVFASKERETTPRMNRPSTAKSVVKVEDVDLESAEVASQPPKISRAGRATLDDADVETAEWAAGSQDRRVKTVSDEQEVEVAEPLLDAQKTESVAAELFEEEASIRVKKTASNDADTEEPVASKEVQARPGRTSYDGSSTHPWAEKSPVATRTPESRAPGQPAQSRTPARPATTEPIQTVAAGKPNSKALEESRQDDTQKAEAKARVQLLLTQAKSLLNKEEFRSAYRVAQLAQRIADSEDLFFVAGEEQPADVVRGVLMKIRMEENGGAIAKNRTAPTEEEAPATKVAATRHPLAKVQAKPASSNRPQGWAFAEWQDQKRSAEESASQEPSAKAQAASRNNPWSQGLAKSSARSEMRIEPGPTQRGSRGSAEFPHSRTEWRSSTNEPLTLSSSAELESPGIASVKDGHRSTKVVQADLNASPGADTHANSLPSHVVPGAMPQTFSERSVEPVAVDWPQSREKSTSDPLASAEDWRTRDLTEIGTTRSPLRIAPLPPSDSIIPETLGDVADAVDDTVAIDIQEPAPLKSESKLWMILAAAGGAFAMLFIRRRPVALPRSSGDVQ